ncbi:MAG: hypothetical protein KIT10_10760 [Flavobacteriales bacterium]|nr:hypothetical protein [Flavobacteriales bacterium]
MSHQDYDHLIAKLDAFIRKFYKDRVIRGALYATGALVLIFLAVALLEHLGRFGTGARTLLFWGALALMGLIVARHIAIPLLKLFRLGETISHEKAASIIGDHFGEVKDKLLNTLQLRGMGGDDPQQRALVEAAIAQRGRELGPIPFTNAIDLRRNRRYLRYALPPLAILFILLVAAPTIITGPTQRLIRHGSEFVPEAPFRFVILNDELQVPEQQDFELLVELRGDVVPQQVDIDIAGRRIPLVKKDATRFMHRFRNVQQAIDFQLAAEGFHSATHTLGTIPHPMLLDLRMELDYPAYLGRANETIANTGDVVVPAGTRITWQVQARSADRLEFQFDDSTLTLLPVAKAPGADVFSTTRRFLQGHTYRMAPRHGDRPGDEPMRHRVEVVPDLHPSIRVETRTDSTALKRLFYRGEIGDDHGLKRLVFHYRFVEGGDSLPPEMRQSSNELRIDPRSTRQEFFHSWDLYGLPLSPGDRIEHWFEVWDNDGVNGSKSARSSTQVFAAPSLKELEKQLDQDSEAVKSGLKESIQEAQTLQRDLDRLRREMLDKKELNWQDRQKLENILQRQDDLRQSIERSNEQLRQSHQRQQEFRPMDERLMEKQQQLQELFENILTEEMKELYRQVQELMEKLDKDQLQEQMKDLKLSQEDVEKELDRALEIFKRMEVEQKAEDIAQQLRDLSKKQEDLSDETRKGDTSAEELKEKQEALNEAFQELRESIQDLQEKNQALEKPMDLPDTGAMEEEIGKDQKQSSDQLDKKQNQKASGAQKDAADKMDQLAHSLESAVSDSAQEQQEEDMDALRQLLENILHLSFEQESLMGQVATTTVRDPRLVEQGRKQRKLRDDAKVVEDSLFALSKRVPQLQSIVNREMNAVNDNMDEATQFLGEARANDRYKPMAADRQQHAMTSLNNLALLLDEALQQMMQDNQQSGKAGECDKPGNKPGKPGAKPGMGKMKSQQEALQKQLEEMRKAMEKGPKPGQQKPGGMGMGQQLAQLAAQQAAIRQEMQRLAQEMNKDGSGAGNELNKLAEKMEQQERDIVNRNITPETMRRQQDIMTRLLEHEKAERERELDQKRTSNEGIDQPPADPARYFEHMRRKAREAELLRTVPPGLKPYYRDRVNAYFGTFDRP